MTKMDCDLLNEIADEIREDIIKMSYLAGDEGLLTSLDWVEVFVFLYWRQLSVESKGKYDVDRDRVVVADATALPAYYATLSRRGFFNREQLWCYRSLGGVLQGRASILTPGVDAPFLDPISSLMLTIGFSSELQKIAPSAIVYITLPLHECVTFVTDGGFKLLRTIPSRICIICKFSEQDHDVISKLRSVPECDPFVLGNSCSSEFSELRRAFLDTQFDHPALICLNNVKSGIMPSRLDHVRNIDFSTQMINRTMRLSEE